MIAPAALKLFAFYLSHGSCPYIRPRSCPHAKSRLVGNRQQMRTEASWAWYAPAASSRHRIARVRNTEAGRPMLASGAITGSRLIAGGGNNMKPREFITLLA